MKEVRQTGYGYCQCGCGQKTRLAKGNDRHNGIVKGEPFRYIAGHHLRGRKMSEAMRAHLSASRMGHPVSLEARAKMSASKKGAKSVNWKGGRIRDPRGYVRVMQPDHPFALCYGYVSEHRLVMEQMIGRYLTREEVVHHRNGIVDDNQPENLQLFANQYEHRQYHIILERQEKEKEISLSLST